MRTKRILSLAALLVGGQALLGQDFTLDWFTLDGGGGASTGGVYSVTGTIGQPDASTAMTGGNYSLAGGFWSLIAVAPTPGAPTLTITLNPQLSTLNITWPYPSSGFALQQNSTVANPAGWSAYGGTVSTNNGVNSITLSPPVGSLFFRLYHP